MASLHRRLPRAARARAFLLASLLIPAALWCQNLVRNAGFEEGPQGGWGHFIPTECEAIDCRMGVDAGGRSGLKAAWIEAPALARHGILQYADGAQGGRLRFSAWVRSGEQYLAKKNSTGAVLRLNFIGSNRLAVKDAKGQSLAAFTWLGGKIALLSNLDAVTVERAPMPVATKPANVASPAPKAAVISTNRSAPPRAETNKSAPAKASPPPAAKGESKAAPSAKPLPAPPPPAPAWLSLSTNWQRMEMVVDAPPGTVSLELGLFAWWAKGRIWFDDITLERVGKEIALTPLFR